MTYTIAFKPRTSSVIMQHECCCYDSMKVCYNLIVAARLNYQLIGIIDSKGQINADPESGGYSYLNVEDPRDMELHCYGNVAKMLSMMDKYRLELLRERSQ